jgi:hypothetical protein
LVQLGTHLTLLLLLLLVRGALLVMCDQRPLPVQDLCRQGKGRRGSQQHPDKVLFAELLPALFWQPILLLTAAGIFQDHPC